MGYMIAAYVVVLGSLLLYGLRLQVQRRALSRQHREDAGRESAPR